MRYDVDSAMDSHFNNLSRLAGRDVRNRYEYIMTSDNLLKSFVEARRDLQYPLRKEVKRDRYILNAQALEKALEEAINKALTEVEKGMTEVANNTVDDVVTALNGITTSGNKFVAKPIKRSFAADIGKMFGKAIAKSTAKIFSDMMNVDNRRR